MAAAGVQAVTCSSASRGPNGPGSCDCTLSGSSESSTSWSVGKAVRNTMNASGARRPKKTAGCTCPDLVGGGVLLAGREHARRLAHHAVREISLPRNVTAASRCAALMHPSKCAGTTKGQLGCTTPPAGRSRSEQREHYYRVRPAPMKFRRVQQF